MTRGPDAATQLIRALEQTGPGVVVSQRDSTCWASVTFTGGRHRMTLQARATPGFDRWLAALAEAEFALRGHLVADLAILSIEQCNGRTTATIEALTVED